MLPGRLPRTAGKFASNLPLLVLSTSFLADRLLVIPVRVLQGGADTCQRRLLGVRESQLGDDQRGPCLWIGISPLDYEIDDENLPER